MKRDRNAIAVYVVVFVVAQLAAPQLEVTCK